MFFFRFSPTSVRVVKVSVTWRWSRTFLPVVPHLRAKSPSCAAATSIVSPSHKKLTYCAIAIPCILMSQDVLPFYIWKVDVPECHHTMGIARLHDQNTIYCPELSVRLEVFQCKVSSINTEKVWTRDVETLFSPVSTSLVSLLLNWTSKDFSWKLWVWRRTNLMKSFNHDCPHPMLVHI